MLVVRKHLQVFLLTSVLLVVVLSLVADARKGYAAGSQGNVFSWGFNASGQLGDGSNMDRNVPVQVRGAGGKNYLTGVVMVSAGGQHTVARKSDGTVWTWGEDNYGQLGNGSYTPQNVPVQVRGPGGVGYLTGVAEVSAGGLHTIARKSDGTVWAWGWNQYGQLGDGSNTDRNVPVQVRGPGGVGYLTGIVAVSGSGYDTIALKSDGTVWAWGYNYFGELGDGSNTPRNVPVQVLGPGGVGYLTGVVAVSAGVIHTIALKSDGTVWAWGSNDKGQLGDGGNMDRNVPGQVLGPGGVGYLTGIGAVSAGDHHTISLNSDGTVWAWGYNYFGELGDGSYTDRNVPVQVLGPGGVGFLTGVGAVNGYFHHVIARKSDGSVWAWGWNQNGQLGDGTNGNRNVPVQVRGPGGVGFLTDVVAVSGGSYHSVAVKNSK